jgi:hypothetical protein
MYFITSQHNIYAPYCHCNLDGASFMCVYHLQILNVEKYIWSHTLGYSLLSFAVIIGLLHTMALLATARVVMCMLCCHAVVKDLLVLIAFVWFWQMPLREIFCGAALPNWISPSTHNNNNFMKNVVLPPTNIGWLPFYLDTFGWLYFI